MQSIASNVSIALVTQTILGKEVVVTASRVPESILKSPVAIEKLDIRAIRESPAPSFYDALENVKGVQMTTSSFTFKVPNTRGFNIPNNFRFMQLVDGVDMQAATLGVPLGKCHRSNRTGYCQRGDYAWCRFCLVRHECHQRYGQPDHQKSRSCTRD